jgi:multiple sugar transport system ATP-binding protein
MSALNIRNVRKVFGAVTVLDDIDLEAESGEFIILVGASGCGKSTLLNMIAGLDMPTSGTIHIAGRDVTRLPSKDRDIAMVFQSYALYPTMSVAGNIAFGLEMRKVPKAERDAAVARVARMLQIEPLLTRKPAQLSGGQRQRVAMGRALARNPKLFLFDEPLSNLDAKLRVEMRAELIALQRKTGLTTIYVTHDQEEANATADRMAVLDQGHIQQVGAPLDLYDRPANRFVAGFLGAANLIDGTIAQESGRTVFRAAVFALALTEPQAPGPASLTFRPQSVELSVSGAAEPAFPATVRSREFLGTLIRYHVAVGPHRILVDALHQRGAQVFAPGEPVMLRVDPGQLHVLR